MAGAEMLVPREGTLLEAVTAAKRHASRRYSSEVHSIPARPGDGDDAKGSSPVPSASASSCSSEGAEEGTRQEYRAGVLIHQGVYAVSQVGIISQ